MKGGNKTEKVTSYFILLIVVGFLPSILNYHTAMFHNMGPEQSQVTLLQSQWTCDHIHAY